MNYWWVNQNKTFEEEYEGDFLWAPARDLYHWRNIKYLKKDDVVFSYAKKRLQAIITITKEYEEKNNPFPKNEDWEKPGYTVKGSYEKINKHIKLIDIPEEFRKELTGYGKPLVESLLKAKQGYLFEVPHSIGEKLLDFIRN